jgi:hypothetical protein
MAPGDGAAQRAEFASLQRVIDIWDPRSAAKTPHLQRVATMDNDDLYLPLESNGPAYTKSEERHGVPLDYVGQKLSCAIEELNRVARQHPELLPELRTTMHYLLVAHLGLHNLLAKANDRSLVDRVLNLNTDELDQWLEMTIRHGDVEGTAGIGLN